MRIRVAHHDHFSLIRNVLCVLPTAENTEGKSAKLARKLMQLLRTQRVVNDTLSASIATASEIFPGRIPRIEVVVQPIYRDLAQPSDGFNPELFKRPEDLRAGVFMVDVRDEETEDPSSAIDFSHYVAVQLGDNGRAGWFSTGRVAQALVHTDIDRVRCLLSDVLLDVAVFHSYARLVETWGASVSGRREFSLMKVEYAKEMSLSSFYGPITDWGIRYFSFAAACRQSCGLETGLDFNRYAEIWDDFVSRVLMNSEKAVNVEVPIERRSPYSQIQRFFRFSGQLPRRKLTRELGQLEAGTYYLLLPQRRPHKTLEREGVAHFFGRAKWRRGPYRILTAEEFRVLIEERTFKRWYSAAYITYFKFTLQ